MNLIYTYDKVLLKTTHVNQLLSFSWIGMLFWYINSSLFLSQYYWKWTNFWEFQWPLWMSSFWVGLFVHTEKSFRNVIKSNRNQIVFTIFRLIWNQTEEWGFKYGSKSIGKMVNTIWFQFDLIYFEKNSLPVGF